MTRQTIIIQTPPLLVARDDAARALGISTTLLEALVRQGELPPPRQISRGRVGWRWAELQAWTEARPVSELAPGPGRRMAS